jgi:hypothetical protein
VCLPVLWPWLTSTVNSAQNAALSPRLPAPAVRARSRRAAGAQLLPGAAAPHQHVACSAQRDAESDACNSGWSPRRQAGPHDGTACRLRQGQGAWPLRAIVMWRVEWEMASTRDCVVNRRYTAGRALRRRRQLQGVLLRGLEHVGGPFVQQMQSHRVGCCAQRIALSLSTRLASVLRGTHRTLRSHALPALPAGGGAGEQRTVAAVPVHTKEGPGAYPGRV